MSNNFIFPHLNDPLLTDDTLSRLEIYKRLLLEEKARLGQKQVVDSSAWDETEKELASLTDDQKEILMAHSMSSLSALRLCLSLPWISEDQVYQ